MKVLKVPFVINRKFKCFSNYILSGDSLCPIYKVVFYRFTCIYKKKNLQT